MQTDDIPDPPKHDPQGLEFIETPLFIARWDAIGEGADTLLDLQVELLDRPDGGKVIPGSGGLRKIRVAAKGRGKRGGARVIYYWRRSEYEILLLTAYAKNEREDLTPKEIRVLRELADA